jgi:hypothetical protein
MPKRRATRRNNTKANEVFSALLPANAAPSEPAPVSAESTNAPPAVARSPRAKTPMSCAAAFAQLGIGSTGVSLAFGLGPS